MGGDFLEGIQTEGLDVFENWAYATRENIRRKICKLFERYIAQCLQENKNEYAYSLLEQWKKIDEFDENIYFHLIDLHHRLGDNKQAVSVFQRYRERLEVELGMRPSVNLVDKIEHIKQGTTAITTPKKTYESPKQQANQTQYLKRGEIYVAYQYFGKGPRTLLIISGFMSHLEQYWENVQLSNFLLKLANSNKVLIFDRRGTGMSDRVSGTPSLQENVEDIRALINELDCKRVSILGISEGGPTAIQLATIHPELVEKLILYGTAAQWVKQAGNNMALTLKQFEHWQKSMVDHWGDGASIRQFAPSQQNDNSQVQWWAKCMRLSSSPSEISRVLAAIKQLNVLDILKDIKLPTLIIHKKGDRIVRLEAAKVLHEGILKSSLLEIDGDDHWIWTENQRVVVTEIIAHIQAPLFNRATTIERHNL